MKTTLQHNRFLLFVIVFTASVSAPAQQLCEDSRRQVTLKDGLEVFLFEERAGDRIYFLPTALQLSKTNGKPGFSYQEYSYLENKTPDGAILHVLITWGLTKQQLGELKLFIRKHYGEDASLGGAVYLEVGTSGIVIADTTRAGKILNASLQSKGSPSTTPGGKMAMSFHIKKEGVEVIREAFGKPEKWSGTTISIHYNYKTYTCRKGISMVKNNTITLTGDLKKWFR